MKEGKKIAKKGKWPEKNKDSKGTITTTIRTRETGIIARIKMRREART